MQLRNFWHSTTLLSARQHGGWDSNAQFGYDETQTVPYKSYLRDKFGLNGFCFIPLITEELALSCSLDILFLRPGPQGMLMQAGDIDNRLKTLFDALRRPQSNDELGSETPSAEGEEIFCLLEDDKLITRVSVNTDTLLEPIDGIQNDNNARLIIEVNSVPLRTGIENLDFVGN
ncbi:MAG: hypothetical protein ABL928_05380 [Sphingorhabdus sp.]